MAEHAHRQRESGPFTHPKLAPVVPVQNVKEGERTVYIADIHSIFGDETLLAAIDRFISDWQPDRIIYVGDQLDFYDLSVFDQNPTRVNTLQSETEVVGARLDYHRSIAPNAEQWWLDGNHEDRLMRYIWRNAPAFAHLLEDGDPYLSVPKLMKLGKRGIRYIPFPGRLDYQGFVVSHGPGGRRAGLMIKMCAKWMAEYVRSSGLCAHFHRYQTYGFNGDHGQQHTFYSIGCTCRLDPEYQPFPEWQQGFAISQIVGGKVYVTPVNAHSRHFVAEGQVYEY